MKRKSIILIIFSTITTFLLSILSDVLVDFLPPSLKNPKYIYLFAGLFLIISVFITIKLNINSNKKKLTEHLKKNNKYKNSNLPLKPYSELIGRERWTEIILNSLRDTQKRWILGIDGMGGIGKTSLSLEVLNKIKKENIFDLIIWDTIPRDSVIVPAKMKKEYKVNEIFNSLGHKLGIPEIENKNLDYKITALRMSFKSIKILYALDNLDTADVNVNSFISSLSSLIDPSKIILTSRIRFDNKGIFPIHLEGLSNKKAKEFIFHESSEKNLDKIHNASETDLDSIVQATGGSPLAIKLIIGQLIRFSLDEVIEQLVNIPKSHNKNLELNEYFNFYRYIFFPSWNSLSDYAKEILILLTRFSSTNGATLDALVSISKMEKQLVCELISELWRLSFIEIGKTHNLNKVRYYLHPLTKHFVLSDILDAK